MSSASTSSSESIILPARVNDENGLFVKVTPLPFSFGKDVGFRIRLDTHWGNLIYDLTKVAYLEDSNGKIYTPKRWDGSPPGGHHRIGILYFPPLSDTPTSMRLVLRGLYGVELRTFEWTLDR